MNTVLCGAGLALPVALLENKASVLLRRNNGFQSSMNGWFCFTPYFSDVPELHSLSIVRSHASLTLQLVTPARNLIPRSIRQRLLIGLEG